MKQCWGITVFEKETLFLAGECWKALVRKVQNSSKISILQVLRAPQAKSLYHKFADKSPQFCSLPSCYSARGPEDSCLRNCRMCTALVGTAAVPASWVMSPCPCALLHCSSGHSCCPCVLGDVPMSLSQIQLLENTLLDWHNRTLRNDYRHAQPLQGRVVEASFRAQRAQGKGQGTPGDLGGTDSLGEGVKLGILGVHGWEPCVGAALALLRWGCAALWVPALPFECHTPRAAAAATWHHVRTLSSGVWCVWEQLWHHPEQRSCIFKHSFGSK